MRLVPMKPVVRAAALGLAVALCGVSPPPEAPRRPLSPVAWIPDPVALEFSASPQPLRLLRTLDVRGPESCARRGDGVLACGCEDGRIVLIDPDVSRVIGSLADTGGRPLGMSFDGTDRLLVADSHRGLLAVSPRGEVKVLRARAPTGDLVFPDDVAVRDAHVWLTDATKRHDFGQVPQEFLERRATGALYDLNAGAEGGQVLTGLAFANGVAVAPDGAYVLVNETGRARVRRWWLKGRKAKTSDIFVKGLPGNPDNVTIDAAGRVWIALVSPRDPVGEALAGRPEARLRRYLAAAGAAPPSSAPSLAPSRIVALDRDGRVLGDWAVPYPELGNVTSVTPTPVGLALGTNKGSHLGLVAWPLPPPERGVHAAAGPA